MAPSKMRQMFCTLLVLFVLAPLKSASAGLIIETIESKAPKVDVRLDAGKLLFSSTSGRQVITLSNSDVRDLVAWIDETQPAGPIVLSMDGSLVPGAPSSYAPPGLRPRLRSLLLQLDAYAHSLACGGIPDDPKAHPLVSSSGLKLMPAQRYLALLAESNNSPESLWYKRLAGHYSEPPDCIGEMTLQVSVGSGALLANTRVDSWLHQLTTRWYRDVDVPSEWDRWAARLPYAPLKRSIESDWPAYRAAFPAMDELTSIAEAISLLRVSHRTAPDSWRALVQTLASEPSDYEFGRTVLAPLLYAERLDRRPWQVFGARSLLQGVHSPSDANRALDWLMSVRGFDEYGDEAPATGGETPTPEVVWGQVKAVAPSDPRIRAKVALAQYIRTPVGGRKELLPTTLAALHGDYPNSFRLRATALNLIGRSMSEEQELAETGALIDAFENQVEARCDSPANSEDIIWWESRSQDVYSTNLISRTRDFGRFDDRFVAALACVHFRRGAAHQVGRELAFRHAHFRFLGYLRGATRSAALQARIGRYQQNLAHMMGLSPWKELSDENSDERLGLGN